MELLPLLHQEVPGRIIIHGHPIHLHHDHDTDLTIGAVHAYCNAILWEYHNE